MSQVKSSTLAKRLAKSPFGKSTFAYRVVSDLINGTNKTYAVHGSVIRPCHTSGSGRFTTNLDYTKDVENLLTFLKVKFETGNDSPRGGKTGQFIKITTKIVKVEEASAE